MTASIEGIIHSALAGERAAREMLEQLASGTALPDALLHQLLDLQANQALVYGLPHARGQPLQRSALTTQADPRGRLAAGEAIARTNDYLRWERRPGILMLDHDEPPPGQPPPEPEQLRAWLLDAAPMLEDAPMLWRPSASSYLYAENGQELQGLRGQRIYLAVRDATVIEEAGQALVARLWAAGLGWIKVGQAGQLLARTIVDAAVWQRSRVDFVAAPLLGDGLTRRPRDAFLWNAQADWFDAQALVANDEIHRNADRARKQAADAARPQAAQAREAWVEEHAPRLAQRRGIELDAARAVLASAAARRVLLGDFELITQDGASAIRRASSTTSIAWPVPSTWSACQRTTRGSRRRPSPCRCSARPCPAIWGRRS